MTVVSTLWVGTFGIFIHAWALIYILYDSMIHDIRTEKTVWTNEELNSLPLSMLIKMGVAAMYQIEKDSNYRIHMTLALYHTYADYPYINVCFAGVMFPTYRGIPSTVRTVPLYEKYPKDSKYGHRMIPWTVALDEIRAGNLKCALNALGHECSIHFPETVRITKYSCNKQQFKNDMWNLAELLQCNGL